MSSWKEANLFIYFFLLKSTDLFKKSPAKFPQLITTGFFGIEPQ